METIKNTRQFTDPQIKDPRIDSPQIKVVYPSAPVVHKDLPTADPTVQPSPPTQPTAPVPQETSAQTAAAPSATGNPATSQNWQEAIKQNSMLFIIVGLLAFGLGFLLAKNKG